jgi:hypothetical protein
MSELTDRQARCNEAMDYLNDKFPDSVYMCVIFPDITVEAWDSKQIPVIIEKLSDNLETFLDGCLRKEMSKLN